LITNLKSEEICSHVKLQEKKLTFYIEMLQTAHQIFHNFQACMFFIFRCTDHRHSP